MNFFKSPCQWNISEDSLGEEPGKNPQSNVRQFNLNLVALCLGAGCVGLTLGWPETSITYNVIIIKCTDLCYDLSRNGSSTIHLIVNLGSCLGALVPACLVDIYGRRHKFCISAIASIVFWLILGIARNNITLMFGAGIGGFSAGLFIVTSTMYVAEISSPDQRGTIGALAAFFAYLGILVSTSFSTIYNHQLVPLFMCFVPIGFLLTIHLWMIESPYFLYESGKTLEAKVALKSLRGAHHILDVELEYKSMEIFFNFSEKELQPSQKLFSSNSRRISVSITLLVLCISQMVGSYAMRVYTSGYLDHIHPQFTKIIIASLDLTSVGICVFLIEKIGRKPLLMLSIGGSSICCLILAIDAILYQANQGHSLYLGDRLVTLGIVILYYASCSLGIAPILPVLTGEVFSSKMKTIFISICFSMLYLAAMINQVIFEMLNFKKGSYVAFLSFTLVGSLGLLFVIVFLPETRAKSLSQIQNELADWTFCVT